MFKYPVKDFNHWHTLMTSAKTAPILKSVGEDLSQFQKQSDFLGGDPKLNSAQLAALRKQYTERMTKLTADNLDPNPPGKPKFKK